MKPGQDVIAEPFSEQIGILAATDGDEVTLVTWIPGEELGSFQKWYLAFTRLVQPVSKYGQVLFRWSLERVYLGDLKQSGVCGFNQLFYHNNEFMTPMETYYTPGACS